MKIVKKLLSFILMLALIITPLLKPCMFATVSATNEIYGINTVEDLLAAIASATEDTDIYLSVPIVISDSYKFANPDGYAITIYPANQDRHFIIKGTDEPISPTLEFENVILDGNHQNGGGIFIVGIQNTSDTTTPYVDTLTLVNAVIQNCFNSNYQGKYGNSRGGAISCTWFWGEFMYNDRNLVLIGDKTRIIDNKANDRGGGIMANHITIGEGVVISGNSALNYAGGVYAFGGLLMTGGTITDNTVTGSSFPRGGGIANYHGDIIITGGTISNNKAISTNANSNNGRGGGIHSMDSSPYCVEVGYGNGNYIKTNPAGNHKAEHYKKVSDGEGDYILMATGFKVEIGGSAEIIDNYTNGDGGGIYAANMLAITGGEIRKNKAVNGGGAYATNIDKITDGMVLLNEASQDGGGIYSGNDFNMSGGQISKNTAARNGGGVFASAWNPNIDVDNLSTFVYTSENFILGGTISGNTAQGNGGGVYTDLFTTDWTAYYGSNPYFMVDMTISDASIKDNQATYGGGIFLNGTLSATSGEIIRNEASQDGGGIWVDYDYLANLSVDKDVTFSGNTAIAAYYMNDKEDISLHESKIITTARSTPPADKPNFAYAYNNYDINYTAAGAENPPATYTITYDANGGNGDVPEDNSQYFSSSQVAVLDKSGLSRMGYIFKGWAVTSGGAVEYKPSDVFDMSDYGSSIVLYAVWEKIYTVTLNNIGTGSTGAGTYEKGTIVTIYAGRQTDYVFSGWIVNESNVTVANNTFIMPANDVIITANWTRVNGGGNLTPPTTLESTTTTTEKPVTTQMPTVKETTTAEESADVESEIEPPKTTTLSTTETTVIESSIIEESSEIIIPTDEKITSESELPDDYSTEQTDKDLYEIYDESGIPLGSLTVPEGELIEELSYEDIINNLIPLGEPDSSEESATEFQTPTVQPEMNPQTSDLNCLIPLILTLSSFASVLLLYKNKKRYK